MTSMDLDENLGEPDPLIVGIQCNPVQGRCAHMTYTCVNLSLSSQHSYLFSLSTLTYYHYATANADELLPHMAQDGFDYLVTRLPRPNDAPRRDILALELKTWRHSVVGIIPPSSSLEEEWRYALEWAVHMTLPAVIFPPLPKQSPSLESYARFVQWAVNLCRSCGCKLWVPVTPLDDTHLKQWRWLVQYCHFPDNLGMLLQFENYPTSSGSSGATPSTVWVSDVLHRLHVAIGSGSVFAVKFACDQFLTNRKGYPTLSKAHQPVLTYLLRRLGRRIRVLVEQAPPAQISKATLPLDALGATQCLPHLQYLQHIRQRPAIRSVLDTQEARMEADYLDCLQQPLQPLKDHLENQTYDTFEKDPVKYTEYGRAIRMALEDRASRSAVVLAVVGAGRGPLVTAALQAYASLAAPQRPQSLYVWAVEKNPSAVVRLQSLCQYNALWKGRVQVLHADLRSLSAQALGGRPFDIVVSELLGSWGCNELSPECLEGLWTTDAVHAQTISIPSSYTSYVAPVASVKLWQQAREQSLYPNEFRTRSLGLTKAMETGYVVRPHEASQMMEAKACWDFDHPATAQDSLERSATLEFQADPDAVIQGCGYGALDTDLSAGLSSTNDVTVVSHNAASTPWTLTGLLGTFSAVLYQREGEKDEVEAVYLSTCPTNFSVGMFSWFPLYLPLETPLTVPTGAVVRVHVWRRVSTDAVWYEWAVGVWKSSGGGGGGEGGGEECLSLSPIHNQNGQSSKVSLVV